MGKDCATTSVWGAEEVGLLVAAVLLCALGFGNLGL